MFKRPPRPGHTPCTNAHSTDHIIDDDGKIKQIIAIFTPFAEAAANPKLKLLAVRIYQLMKGRNR